MKITIRPKYSAESTEMLQWNFTGNPEQCKLVHDTEWVECIVSSDCDDLIFKWQAIQIFLGLPGPCTWRHNDPSQ